MHIVNREQGKAHNNQVNEYMYIPTLNKSGHCSIPLSFLNSSFHRVQPTAQVKRLERRREREVIMPSARRAIAEGITLLRLC
jgi:hypothetical protein